MRVAQIYLAFTCFLFASSSLFGQSDIGLSWSEDGKQAAFESDGQKFLIDVAAGTKKRVEELPEFAKSISHLTLPPLRSIDGGGSTSIEIKNETERAFRVIWVTSSGRESDYENSATTIEEFTVKHHSGRVRATKFGCPCLLVSRWSGWNS